MLHIFRGLSAFLLLSVSVSGAFAENETMRYNLSSPVFLSGGGQGGGEGPPDGGGNTVDEPITANISGDRPAFVMVNESIEIGFSHAGGEGPRTVSLTGNATGLSISGDAIVGSILSPGTYEYGILVDDEGSGTPLAVGPYSLEVDPLLTVGNPPSAWVVLTGVQTSIPLPATSGFGPVSVSVVDAVGDAPADVSVQGNSLQVLATASSGPYHLVAQDGRSRTVNSADFAVVVQQLLTANVAAAPAAYAMVGETFTLPVTTNNGIGLRSIAMGGSLPGVAVNPGTTTLTGTLTTAGTHQFSVVASDGGSPDVSLGPWTVTVDPQLTIGTVPAQLDVVNGEMKEFNLPAVAGYSPTLSLQTNSGSTTAVTLVGGKIRVNATTTGTIGSYRIKATDARGREILGNAFSVVSTAALPKPVSSVDTYVQSVTGTPLNGGDAKSNSAYRNIVFTNSTPVLQVNSVKPVMVQYTQLVEAVGIRYSSLPSDIANCPSTPGFKFASGSPVWKLSSSLDGVTWHEHTEYQSDFYTSPGCGVLNNSVRFDTGVRQFRYIKLELISAVSQTGAAMYTRVPLFRAYN